MLYICCMILQTNFISIFGALAFDIFCKIILSLDLVVRAFLLVLLPSCVQEIKHLVSRKQMNDNGSTNDEIIRTRFEFRLASPPSLRIGIPKGFSDFPI